MLKILRLVILLALFGAGAYGVLTHYVRQIPLTLSEPLVTVPAGSSAASLCRQWQARQLLSSAQCLALKLYLKLHPADARVQQGVYRKGDEQTLLQMLALFRSGKEAQFALTFIEGETTQQSLARLAQADYLQLDLQSAAEVLA